MYPYFNNVDSDSFLCGYNYFHKHLLNSVRENSVVDCLQIFLAMQLKFPLFDQTTIKSIWSPTNSVDAECFFSKLNLIVTERHARLQESNIGICSMLYFQ